MIYSSESNIIVRNMDYSDIPLIVIPEIEQEGKIEMEKYICRLEEQEKCKNISLVAEYNDLIVGYINIYPYEMIFRRPVNNDFVRGKVIFKHKYDTYEDLLRAEGVQKILPFLNNDDILTAIQFFQIFRSFKFIEQFGCIALGIKILDEKN